VATLVLPAGSRGGLLDLLATLERRCVDEQLHGAGFLCYEAAPLLGTGLRTRPPGPLPLAWFALFRETRPITLPAPPAASPGTAWQPSVNQGSYREAHAFLDECFS